VTQTDKRRVIVHSLRFTVRHMLGVGYRDGVTFVRQYGRLR
jgi:hypothetical protein